MLKEYTDSRDAVFQEIFELAKHDRNVMILSGDTGAFIFKKMQEELPGQFFNLGIAEQNMMSVAAGLAHAGKKPFVYAITNFTTFRCLEQIRIDVCGANLPIKILGTGTGFTYSSDGLTHHITEDLTVMRVLPNLTIYSPSDYNSMASLIINMYDASGPTYLRFDKGPFERKYGYSKGFNQSTTLHGKEGSDIVIVATGITVDLALKAAEHFDGVSIFELIRLKPSPKYELEYFLRHAKHIIVYEEHSIIGGLGSIVEEVICEFQLPGKLKKFGINDRFTYEVGNREYLREVNNLDPETIVKYIYECC